MPDYSYALFVILCFVVLAASAVAGCILAEIISIIMRGKN